MAGLPDPQTAIANLSQGIQQRVVLDTLASRGYPARSTKEAEWLLNMAGQVAALGEEATVKEAEDANHPYALANRALDQMLAKHGLQSPVKQAEFRNQQAGIERAAAHLMQDTSIYDSVLSLKAAEVEETARRLGVSLPN